MVNGSSGFRKVWKTYTKKTRFYIHLFTHFKATFPQEVIFAEILQKSNSVANFLINYVLFLLERFCTGSLKSHLSWGI